MEESYQNISKKIYLSILAFVLVVILILIGLFQWKSVVNFYYKAFPPNISSTGAAITPLSPSEKESYTQLYHLIDRGIVIEEGFEIQPIKNRREVNVLFDAPTEENIPKFEDWLILNGYSSIPKEKIHFFEKEGLVTQ